VVLVVLVCALIVPSTAGAFVVDSTADEVDIALGNELCETDAEECTLRAAIEEANSLGESATINFDEETFENQATATIELESALPTLNVSAVIEGRACAIGSGVSRPCVGIDGPAGEAALTVAGDDVEITGLAITGAQTAIILEGSLRSKLRGNWFGVAVDGAIVGNATGVLIDSESNEAFIGGEGTEHRNVFAGSANNGLDIHGSSNARVLGNYFGVKPDGVTPAANAGDDVEIVSTKVPKAGGLEFDLVEASGTEIGTRVNAAAAASPLCDWGCNVISGAASHGVDLQGDGGSEAPAASTYIAGNYIGLDAVGMTAVPNVDAGVNVGEAAHTTVGGPSRSEANRINGGSAAVLAGPAASELAVRGNMIGTDATGETFTPPKDGIVVDSGEVGSPSLEAEIAGNLIAMEDGVAIFQSGAGAWILDNEISGSQTGIRTVEQNSFYGSVIEGNLIEGAASNGILVENNSNELIGNEILGAGGAGIRIDGSLLPFGVSGNLIGGNSQADENVIDGSGGAAIEISNIENTDNEVARNHGAGNGGLFIDLVAASPGTEVGPNRGLQPPTFSAVTQTGASGGAKEGATVRVFRKQLTAAGELESFLGEAVADSAGGWELAYDIAIPAGSIIAATQTVEGATSELAIATTPGSEGGAGGDTGAAFGSGSPTSLENVIARIRPRTKIVKGRARHHTARFVFRSDQDGSAFLCKLDDKPFDLCRSPKRYVSLAPGKHVFWVRAVDPAGRVDLSPAKKKFVVPG
jgi:CSLREA domain-containing protein